MRLRSLFLTLVPLFGSAAVTAQVSTIPGSGCPRGSAVAVTGQPIVGETINFSLTCPDDTTPVLFFGEVLPRRLRIPSAVTCEPGACFLAVNPLLFLRGTSGQTFEVAAPVPMDTGLVGIQIGVQGACVDDETGCIELTPALLVQVMGK